MANDVQRFDKAFQQMDRAYEKYAKSFNMTYSSLALFQLIWENQPCTQKRLCDITMLPKQTVNTIVMSFVRQGYIEMVEQSEDRRHKSMFLSKAGNQFAQKILPKIKEAENISIEQFTEDEKNKFFTLLEKFANAFSDKLNK